MEEDKISIKILGVEVGEKDVNFKSKLEVSKPIISAITGLFAFYICLDKLMNKPVSLEIFKLPYALIGGGIIGWYWPTTFPILFCVDFYHRLLR